MEAIMTQSKLFFSNVISRIGNLSISSKFNRDLRSDREKEIAK